MARGQRKSIEEKIMEKEELIKSLQQRLKNENKELEDLYSEKSAQDIKCIADLLKTAHITPDEAKEVLQNYISANKEQIA